MTRIMRLSAGALVAALIAGAASAADITYAVDRQEGGGSIVGTITTDGARGLLSTADLVSWDLHVNGVGASIEVTPLNSYGEASGADASVTPDGRSLDFDFGGTDGGYLIFQEARGSGLHYYCDAAGSNFCLQGESIVPRAYDDATAAISPESGMQVIGSAAPEPASWALALAGAALIGGAMRRRRASAQESVA